MEVMSGYALSLPAALSLAESPEPIGTPTWVVVGIMLLILFILGWALIDRPWATTVAEREEAEAARAAAQAAPVAVAESEAPEQMESATAEGAPPPEPDDLKKIEGIGPKIQQILTEAGITTFADLADTEVATLNKIVREDAGLTIAFPDTWPMQARLAATGDWQGLEVLQEDLKGGRHDDD